MVYDFLAIQAKKFQVYVFTFVNSTNMLFFMQFFLEDVLTCQPGSHI